MNSRLLLRAVATISISLFSFGHPLVAAGKKVEPQRKALVAALQAVSPDALGGKLGLSLAAENPPLAVVRTASRSTERLASQQSAKTPDNLAYRSWKTSKSS